MAMNHIITTLKFSVGKNISDICKNNFHSRGSKHGVHYVSHAIGFSRSFSCKDFKNGSHKGGCIRFNDLFSACPKIGSFIDADLNEIFIIFITKDGVIDVINNQIKNLPQRNIGIYVDNSVYHYSNKNNKVMKSKLNDFIRDFQDTYNVKHKLYYGAIPDTNLSLKVSINGDNISKNIPFNLIKKEKKWHAEKKGSDKLFYIGKETRFRTKNGVNFGVIQNSSEAKSSPRFDPNDYVNQLDHWAYLIYAISYCESKGNFTSLNTYDRARFTYGFFQLAAHTPNNNLILLFKKLMQLKNAKSYFPELDIIEGHLHRIDQNSGETTNLETIVRTGRSRAKRLQLFMKFLNPSERIVDEQEILHAARLIHWTINDPAARAVQVEVANNILQRKMDIHHRRYNLHGRSDTTCTLIADIHHQGRAKVPVVLKALQSRNPHDALFGINPRYKNRERNLRFIVGELTNEGKLGRKTYDAANKEFI